MRQLKSFIPLFLFFMISIPVKPGIFDKEWYFTWGYNRDWWSNSDIKVVQPNLGNNFTVYDVKGHDVAEWDHGAFIFDKEPFVPQFNLRFGFYFNEEQDMGIEFSLDHTKYSTTLDQTAAVKGTINNQAVDTQSQLTTTYFRYDLHNGANHIMASFVKRFSLLGELNQNFNLTFLGKAGAGIMLPHASNTIFGNDNNVGPKNIKNSIGYNSGWWQLNGWTAGVEAAFRIVLYKPIFFELADKYTFAAFSNVPVYQGRASQNVFMNEVIFSIGITLHPFSPAS